MAAAADGYKRVAGGVKVRNWADKSLCHLCISCSRLTPTLVRLFCQMYGENIPALQRSTQLVSVTGNARQLAAFISFSRLEQPHGQGNATLRASRPSEQLFVHDSCVVVCSVVLLLSACLAVGLHLRSGRVGVPCGLQVLIAKP